jgi:hypothetical protein
MNNAWENWVKELKQLSPFSQSEPTTYSGKRLSEIQTKLCLAWFIARDTVPHTTAHRYIKNTY